MEVNARLQVEHPVTEATTGVDLVKLQLRVAAGHALKGDPPPVHGHAVEARLCAEDPEHGFEPAPGRIAMLRLATGTGIRIDSGVRECDTISGDFDSMIAKIVAWGQDREEALARLRRALAQSAVVVDGGTTNRSFLVGILDRPEVLRGEFDNRWLDRLTTAGEHVPEAHPVALLAAAVEAYAADHAAAEAAFHAGARRGRPEMPETVGTTVRLRYAGALYDLRVYRTSPDSYRVRAGRVDRGPRGRLHQRVRTPGAVRGPVPPGRRCDPGTHVPDRRGRHHPPDHPRRRRRGPRRMAGVRGGRPRPAR